ncbi:cobalt-zinc-cadmium efflux system membrane fusion protein [Salegentibacter sp. 24]|uniref:efflux RND transporter periplasmic adaptor subunit n=1 Tax=Salegentibacter sp. 24 TaxID=2183986 RepID=UPI00105F903B|nr:efflux RND transporter periplasmic adaptor subunit [Salegentibacter sp. 24]TDN93430.1 cobalt-zinc-cadmium efflux system membrane fusion protein [Salegentibacter sp. 24]
MKSRILNILLFTFLIILVAGCRENSGVESENTAKINPEKTEEGEHSEMPPVYLSELKFNSLGIKTDTLTKKALTGIVEANGELEVPPQYEATVTAILGGNVTSIKVIEGDKVKKNQVLAYLSHPTLTAIQSDYISAFSKMQFLEKEFERQKRLYEAQVASGKSFQQTQSDYQSVQGEVRAYESQLRQLNLNPSRVINGELYEYIPVVSPIEGYIEKVMVQIGQYVEPQTSMFMVVDNEHVHADLMVFEKDIHKVKEGQKISFTLESVPGSNLTGEIYSVGKQFEKSPKAVHVHAEIQNKKNYLIPGMYIQGKIRTNRETVTALPEEAVIEEDGKSYIFTAQKSHTNDTVEWKLDPVEIRTGITEDGWVEINLLDRLPKGTLIVYNNAYYLISEMQKSQASHAH